MSMNDRESMIDALTISVAGTFGTDIKRTKEIIKEVANGYRVIKEEIHHGNELSTGYLMDKFLEAKRAQGMRHGTLKQYSYAVTKLEQYTGKILSDAEPEDINRFFSEYKKSVTSVTVSQKYHLLSSVYNFLFTRRYIGYNPIEQVDPPKIKVACKRQLTSLDLERIKKACTETGTDKEKLRNTALIYFFVSTGCRVSEVCNTRIGNIDFERKCCKVTGKGNKERVVVLTDTAIFRIKLYLDTRKNKDMNDYLFASTRGKEHSLTPKCVEVMLQKMRERLSIKELTCHTFRRFYATELRRKNVNIQLIAKSLGHANLNQINRYALFSNEEMLEEIRHAM